MRHLCECYRPLVSAGADDDERACSRCRGVINPYDANAFVELVPAPGTTAEADLDWSTFEPRTSPADVPRPLGRG
jgi:hypothetical protein